LPAFKLDGEFALEQLLISFLKPTDVNMVTTTHNSLLTRKIQEMIVKATSIVVGFVIVGSLIMGLISSI
jgi:S2P endopeptidase